MNTAVLGYGGTFAPVSQSEPDPPVEPAPPVFVPTEDLPPPPEDES